MSMEIILFLVGMGLIVIGLTGKLKFKETEVEGRNLIVRGILLVMGVVFVSLALFRFFFPSSPAAPAPKDPTPAPASLPAAPTLVPCSFHSNPAARQPFARSSLIGSITYPAHCAMDMDYGTQSRNTTEGTAGQIPDGQALWLLVHAQDGKYYPQCNQATISKADCTLEGEWSMRTYLGDACKPYALVLVAADQAATDFFLSTMIDWENSGSYTGLRRDELKPYQIQELSSVQVETGACAEATPTP